MASRGYVRGTLAERFWPKVERQSGDLCWPWTAATTDDGYGLVTGDDGRMMLAHRASYILVHGIIPALLHVLHRCDNPICVRPSHLFVGTHADNMADMRAKRRHAHGERHGKAVLSEVDVAVIRAEVAVGPRGTASALAQTYGVSRSIISRIKLRKNWSHLMESNVTIDRTQESYVIHHDDHVSCYGFDRTQDEIERIVVELVGRGVLPKSYLERELEAVKAQRGTLAAYDTLINLRDRLKAACEADGDRAVAGLTPQLVGLEGHRVEVEDNGQRRRFIVGKTTGWMPCHLEIKTTRSAAGEAARREYASVRDLGPAR